MLILSNFVPKFENSATRIAILPTSDEFELKFPKLSRAERVPSRAKPSRVL